MPLRTRRSYQKRDAAGAAAYIPLSALHTDTGRARQAGQHNVDVPMDVHECVRDDNQRWAGVALPPDQSQPDGEQGSRNAGELLGGASDLLSQHVRSVRDDRSGDWAHYAGVVLQQLVVHLRAVAV